MIRSKRLAEACIRQQRAGDDLVAGGPGGRSPTARRPRATETEQQQGETNSNREPDTEARPHLSPINDGTGQYAGLSRRDRPRAKRWGREARKGRYRETRELGGPVVLVRCPGCYAFGSGECPGCDQGRERAW